LRGEAEVTLSHGAKPETVYRDTLERIIAYATDMARLVDDLLFLARSETDTVRFNFQRVPLQEIVTEMLRDGEVLARSKHIALEQDIASAPVWVQVDPHRLKQALMILIDNAIKYSHSNGAVTVTVSHNGEYGEVVVRDEGMGIPAEELPHVFERFVRGRISRNANQGGSGLGLAIAKWLVEKQGGELTLRSEEGRFTEVRISIPRAEVRAGV
jgi:signal transduction histidine kinase